MNRECTRAHGGRVVIAFLYRVPEIVLSFLLRVDGWQFKTVFIAGIERAAIEIHLPKLGLSRCAKLVLLKFFTNA